MRKNCGGCVDAPPCIPEAECEAERKAQKPKAGEMSDLPHTLLACEHDAPLHELRDRRRSEVGERIHQIAQHTADRTLQEGDLPKIIRIHHLFFGRRIHKLIQTPLHLTLRVRLPKYDERHHDKNK